jgi:squalene synthase HpnC
LALTHYENFTVGSWLLPRQLLKHFYHIYAYCRWADDLADEAGGGQHALDLLAWWREELLCCYHGIPRHPVMIALQETIGEFHIPPRPFLDLLVAFEQDQQVQEYDTYAQLLEYCRHSANPVGHLVLYLCSCHCDESARLSDHICTGLQLANFWQDIRRDLNIGRIYLPNEDRRLFGYSDDDLRNHRFTSAFRDLLRFEVERARASLHRGLPMLERVTPEVRVDIELFVAGGLGILDAIERQGYDVWARRPTLSKWSKARLFGRAILGRLRTPQPRGAVRP